MPSMRRGVLATCLALVAITGCIEPAPMLPDDTEADEVAVYSTDSSVIAANTHLARGRPWYAYQALRPALADSSRRTPAVVFLAATAASRWGGWREVERLLGPADWTDSLFNGEGRVLLIRAALERNADSLAAERAATAVEYVRDDVARGERLVLLARALDRRNRRDSSRATYLRAAAHLPDLRDWLLLRAAGVTKAASRRDSLYAEVSTPALQARIPRMEATTRERLGDIGGAIDAYDRMADSLSAMRLRLARASGRNRLVVRRRLMAIVRSSPSTREAERAVEILDDARVRLTVNEEMAVARMAQARGVWSRAAAAYGRALRQGGLSSADRYTYGTFLMRLGRYRTAARVFAGIQRPADLVAAASYQRARALLGSRQPRGARTVLQQVLRRYPRDTVAGAALILLADLAMDERRDVAARAALRDAYTRFPTISQAPQARFRAAVLAFAAGRYRSAANELDSLLALHPSAEDGMAARYWMGRALLAIGDTSTAMARWRTVAAEYPMTYYGVLAAQRLGELPWAPPVVPDSFAEIESLAEAMDRVNHLEKLGMESEARTELEILAEAADSSEERLLATGYLMREHGLVARGVQLGMQAIRASPNVDARAYRLVYPIVHREAIILESRRRNLDAALVAAIIKQESGFNPRATSSAGARGLMQMMPAVGRAVARSIDVPEWRTELLYQPDINLQLGIRHLEAFISRYDAPYALAAYNAGESRLKRWLKRPGARDPEMFVERIPFTETRDYVRIVLRNRAMYRALYTW
ncbi:MAG TPA: transglycosylase SLT domain-containing protein [Gemmatimonadaceae bacterium]|nr:transglycosylase SLT domain-containing protein [Gemmatimonadaceae bacterium]